MRDPWRTAWLSRRLHASAGWQALQLRRLSSDTACADALLQVLFLQEAISGTASEFRQPTGEGAPTGQARLPEWCLVNGLWSLFLAFGLVLTALLTRQVPSAIREKMDVSSRPVQCVAALAGCWAHAHTIALVTGTGSCCHPLLLCVIYPNSAAAASGASTLILLAQLHSPCASILSWQARAWRFGRGWVRSFLADYGVPLMVVAWSGLAYAIAKPSPGGLPRRVQMPNTWDVKTTWTVAGVRTAEPPRHPLRQCGACSRQTASCRTGPEHLCPSNAFSALQLAQMLLPLATGCHESSARGACTKGLPLRSLATVYGHRKIKMTNTHPLQDMGRVPGVYIAGALVPALIITILFYFDHAVSSQLAQVFLLESSVDLSVACLDGQCRTACTIQ
jgi:hypothetical protein